VKVETDTQTDLPFPHACPCSVSLYHWGVHVLDFQYVSDSYLGTVSIYKHGRFPGLLQDVSGKVIKFKTPTRLYYHPSGYLYVVDAQDHKVQSCFFFSGSYTVGCWAPNGIACLESSTTP
jgi:hypothetical protein